MHLPWDWIILGAVFFVILCFILVCFASIGLAARGGYRAATRKRS